MLRVALLVLGAGLALTGAALLARGVSAPGAQALGIGALILLGTVFERWRYRPHHPRPPAGWERTGERYEDPETGHIVDVYYDPRSGERRYVRDGDPAP